MAQSGDTLPQVTAGGYLEGTMHVVTSDGFGPYKAMMDPTATGDFSGAKSMVMMTQVPGNKGNGKKTQKRAWERALEAVGIMKRATNINEDFPFKVAIPADAKCTGSMAGMENVCMVKLVNPSAAGVSSYHTHYPSTHRHLLTTTIALWWLRSRADGSRWRSPCSCSCSSPQSQKGAQELGALGKRM